MVILVLMIETPSILILTCAAKSLRKEKKFIEIPWDEVVDGRVWEMAKEICLSGIGMADIAIAKKDAFVVKRSWRPLKGKQWNFTSVGRGTL